MYLANTLSRDALPKNALRRVAAGNVVALGMVSLFTDVSSEMVTAVLPAYLVLGLHLSLVQYGFLDGLYTGATAFTRLLGGWLADKHDQRKGVAFIGYGLSAVSKIGLLVAGTPAGIGATLAIDRTGKGIRTAPRDAMIAQAVDPADLGAAFGVHRTLDNIGAFLGPLAALGLLLMAGSAVGTEYGSVFVGSACMAVLGLVILVVCVRNKTGGAPRQPLTHANLRQLTRTAAFPRLCLAAALLGGVTVGDGFVFLALQRRDELPISSFPLMAAGTSITFILLAIPLGRLADRIGRWPVVAGGYGCLLAVYLLLAADHGHLVLILALYGAFYACTDGVLPALAAPLIPRALLTSGLAVLQTGQAIAYFASSVAFGFAWQYVGLSAAAGLAAVVAALVLPVCVLIIRGQRQPA